MAEVYFCFPSEHRLHRMEFADYNITLPDGTSYFGGFRDAAGRWWVGVAFEPEKFADAINIAESILIHLLDPAMIEVGGATEGGPAFINEAA
jgi:hypothetical protein